MIRCCQLLVLVADAMALSRPAALALALSRASAASWPSAECRHAFFQYRAAAASSPRGNTQTGRRRQTDGRTAKHYDKKESETSRRTSGRTDRQADIHADSCCAGRSTDRLPGRHKGTGKERQTNGQTDTQHRHRQRHRQSYSDIQTERRRHRHTGRQTDRLDRHPEAFQRGLPGHQRPGAEAGFGLLKIEDYTGEQRLGPT